MAGVMKCPKCRLVNPPIAQRCDCGWDFVSQRHEQSFLEPKSRIPMAAGIGGGVIALLIVARLILGVLRAVSN